ncbi:hypothetical protein TVAG_054350 [Trichomonas vaginalis G3]|uniref:DUF3447 domain-containing protein n=1 Tax=Trichomonas vaginalis (strain ATCC PRA-98 / G3) TaxID=412133 RepID=A2EYB0_TRIV3|nr:spectrin binding [Trichomonas vaginalis G3]EAY02337.1 hypothetical protein TVAG_054350 [Trichomonas vaginalis G3]KAI5514059.1 spectrin binding [Trichomonas vaginalis G3]|eukprot:XP_001314652.1 hypothetical protein [Trichomonas vaginalis G3]
MEHRNSSDFEPKVYQAIDEVTYPSYLHSSIKVENMIWVITKENLESTAKILVESTKKSHISQKFIQFTIDAATKRYDLLEALKLLINVNKYNVNVKNIDQLINSQNENYSIFINDDIEKYQTHCYDKNSKYSLSISANIYNAAAFGAINIFKFLIMNQVSFENQSIAKKSVVGGNFELIKTLVNKGVEFKDTLVEALKYHRNDVADWIISNYGCSHIKPYHCIKWGNMAAVIFYIENGMKIDNHLLDHVAVNFCMPMVDYLITKKANFATDSVVEEAVKVNNYHLLKMIFESGYKPPQKLLNHQLIVACQHGYLEASKILIHSGADVNSNTSSVGTMAGTPLYYANLSNNKELPKYLIDKGAMR